MKNSFPVEAFVMQFNEIFYKFQIRCMTLVDIPRMNCYMAYFWNKTFCSFKLSCSPALSVFLRCEEIFQEIKMQKHEFM